MRPRRLTRPENLKGLVRLNARSVQRGMARTAHRRVILDTDSSESPVYGEQKGAAYNGHFGSVCHHPLFGFNQFGDCEGATLRPVIVQQNAAWELEFKVPRHDEPEVQTVVRGLGKPLVQKRLSQDTVGARGAFGV